MFPVVRRRQEPTIKTSQKTVAFPHERVQQRTVEHIDVPLQAVELWGVPQKRISEYIVDQFIDVPVCQILDETTAVVNLAPH